MMTITSRAASGARILRRSVQPVATSTRSGNHEAHGLPPRDRDNPGTRGRAPLTLGQRAAAEDREEAVVLDHRAAEDAGVRGNHDAPGLAVLGALEHELVVHDGGGLDLG